MSSTKTTPTAFFSSVRTSPKLKKQVEKILSELGLSWGAFVNNAAKKLLHEKQVIFEIRDEAGFTPHKGSELSDALKEIKQKKNITKPMKAKQAQDYLNSL